MTIIYKGVSRNTFDTTIYHRHIFAVKNGTLYHYCKVYFITNNGTEKEAYKSMSKYPDYPEKCYDSLILSALRG